MKSLTIIIVLITGAVLFYGTVDMPDWGDPNSPASRHVSPRYITQTVAETETPNIVTSLLADYRGYDTLGETTVIFGAGMVCILILRSARKREE
ncbi:MAG: hypothetical protein JXD19_04170 [Deltaproteobacteria bacterium]|nr:hypothetical protein [Deltaproteobacteria bacterium]